MHCCDQQDHPAQPSAKVFHSDCLSAGCQCAFSCAQVQAFERPSMSMPVFQSISDRAISLIAPLLTADSPKGLWRPPRAA